MSSFDKQYADRLFKDAYHRVKTKDFGRKDLDSLLNQAGIQAYSNLQHGFSYNEGKDIGYKEATTSYKTTIHGVGELYHSSQKDLWKFLNSSPVKVVTQKQFYIDMSGLTQTNPTISYQNINPNFKITVSKHRF